MPEHYVHPPLVAREPRSDALAVWRFRIVAILLLLLLTGLVAWGMIKALGIGAEDPGFSGSLKVSSTVAAER